LSNILIYFLVTSFLCLSSRSKWIAPAEYAGQWNANNRMIMVHTKAKGEPYRFTPGVVSIKIKINADKTVSGKIEQQNLQTSGLKRIKVCLG
jgi:hypothetical protein